MTDTPSLTSSKCTCDDESPEQKTCLNCKTSWFETTPQFVRIMKCPQHHMPTPVVWIPPQPPLCQTCKDAGYELEMKLDGYVPIYQVVIKKN